VSGLPDHETAPREQPPRSRRALLAGAGAACAVVLTGCTTYDANNGGLTGPPPSSADTAGGTASGSTASGSGASGSAAPGTLASTAEVPEGGGKIIDGVNVVLTQPQAGSFKGFSAVCTHQGCIVDSISDGIIGCPCHGSEFSIKDGSVVRGPATRPLPPVAIKVEGTSIVQG
jgi:nitrite reductase/ring-hydroxylating ferredoxin subunit